MVESIFGEELFLGVIKETNSTQFRKAGPLLGNQGSGERVLFFIKKYKSIGHLFKKNPGPPGQETGSSNQETGSPIRGKKKEVGLELCRELLTNTHPYIES